ncbi:MAG: hypothetical protein D6718_09705 [Acidobacteria bacterium]|nr:MAG: hypothetical protein D6718_09705 [Acidobacteriota bacterium]
MRLAAVTAIAAAVVAASLGCGSVRAPAYRAAEGPGPVWPSPPARPRVAWSGEYAARGRGYVRPHGVGVGPEGRVCVADPGARVVWLHDPGRPGRAVGRRHLVSPIDCVLLGDRLFVADSAAGSVVAFDARGEELWRTAADAIERPTGMALDRNRDRLWVADALGHRIVALDLEGRRVAAIGGRGSGPGQFNYPIDVAVGPRGRLFVLDAMNFRVQILDAAGTPVSSFGFAGDGPGTFSRPRGLGVDGEGRIFVADALFDNVQIFDPEGRLLLAVGRRGRGPGQFWMPAGVAIGPEGRLFVADAYNHRVQVFRMLGEGA